MKVPPFYGQGWLDPKDSGHSKILHKVYKVALKNGSCSYKFINNENEEVVPSRACFL